eukprot:851627-Pyramimonas_sp.AAC.1
MPHPVAMTSMSRGPSFQQGTSPLPGCTWNRDSRGASRPYSSLSSSAVDSPPLPVNSPSCGEESTRRAGEFALSGARQIEAAGSLDSEPGGAPRDVGQCRVVHLDPPEVSVKQHAQLESAKT